jgi:hypothetical protein
MTIRNIADFLREKAKGPDKMKESELSLVGFIKRDLDQWISLSVGGTMY